MSFTPGGKPVRQDNTDTILINYRNRIKALEDALLGLRLVSVILDSPPTTVRQVPTWTGDKWVPEYFNWLILSENPSEEGQQPVWNGTEWRLEIPSDFDPASISTGGVLVPTNIKTSDYAANPGELVLVDISSGTVNITLPDVTTIQDQDRIGVKVVSVSQPPAGICIIDSFEDNWGEYNYWGADPTITLTTLFKGAIFQLIKSGEFGDPIWIITTAEDPVPDPVPMPARQDFVHTNGVCEAVSIDETNSPREFYWGNNSPPSPATIGKGTLPDGGNQRQDFITPSATATAIKGIDARGTIFGSDIHVYYTYEDSGGYHLGRALKSDGSSPTDLVTAAGGNSFGAVTMWPADHVYWVVFSTNAIARANLDGSSPDLTFISNIDTGDGNVYGLVALPPYIYWSWQDGTSSYVGRANIDGTSPNSTFITIAGLNNFGKGLFVDSSSIYVSYQETSIRRFEIDGSPEPPDIQGLHGATGIAIAQAYNILQTPQIIVWANSLEGTLVGKAEQGLNYDLYVSGGRGLMPYGPVDLV